MNKHELIQKFGMEMHPEGGYFTETYRSKTIIETDREGQQRAVLTSIYYLLTDDRPIDHFHINKSDIMHYFHGGSAVIYLVLNPNGTLQKFKLGMNLANGETPQLLVPGGYWKAAFLEDGEFGLLGEAVAPGFEYRDMKIAEPDAFRQEFPHLWDQLAPYVKQ